MSTADVRVSVIIPHMNQPDFLIRSLAALAEQTFDMARAEIIVVDNGSKTMPEAACASYANVRLALETTPGPGPARNKGVALSHAPLLAFIDADCLADRNWLNTIVSTFDAEPDLQVVGGDVRIALEDPKRLTMLEAYESVYAYRQKNYIEKQGFSGTGNLAMRRSCYERVGPFAGIAVAEDRTWGQRATAMGYRIRYVPAMIVFHPARKTIAELRSKWDRQIAHDFEEQSNGAVGKLKWLIKAVALFVSPLWETVTIARSDRVRSVADRLRAFRILAEIRGYRSRKALEVLVSPHTEKRSGRWNRG